MSGRLFGPMTEVFWFLDVTFICLLGSPLAATEIATILPGVHIKTQNTTSTLSIHSPSWLPSRHSGSHGSETQPQSHLPSLCKATLILPQGPRDDASWLQAFCRLHTASLEWIRRFQESNYQLTNPEPGQTARVHSSAHGEAVYNYVAVSMTETWCAFRWRWWEGIVIHIKYNDTFWKHCAKKTPDTVMGSI